jgi:hypothetical protein
MPPGQVLIRRQLKRRDLRRAGIMNLAPIPGFGARLEVHRRDIGAGDNEMALAKARCEYW